ncbi:RICIN domain-containing protein [Spongiactinospora rosea]|uniref:RICIN domain-containing protein n=1 Tax=Spongiactinospora rosea TaxID=2248750 RepID=UPI0011C0517F|nr:RICIN domain-containing protein [Spongiactinospora rosea]
MVRNRHRPRAALGRAAVLGALLALVSGLLPAAPAAADDVIFWQNRFSSQLLDVKNGTTANEGPVVQQHYNGQPPNPNGQYWRVVSYGGGLRRAFMNTWSGNQQWVEESRYFNGALLGMSLRSNESCCRTSPNSTSAPAAASPPPPSSLRSPPSTSPPTASPPPPNSPPTCDPDPAGRAAASDTPIRGAR